MIQVSALFTLLLNYFKIENQKNPVLRWSLLFSVESWTRHTSYQMYVSAITTGKDAQHKVVKL